MTNEWEKEYEKSAHMAKRHYRKDVSGFRERRRLELEDLLRTEQEKPEDMRDEAKIAGFLKNCKEPMDNLFKDRIPCRDARLPSWTFGMLSPISEL